MQVSTEAASLLENILLLEHVGPIVLCLVAGPFSDRCTTATTATATSTTATATATSTTTTQAYLACLACTLGGVGNIVSR